MTTVLANGIAERTIRDLLAHADIAVNGSRPWDLRVHDPRFYDRVLRGGTLALGESYVDGWWDAEDLAETFFRVLRSGAYEKAPRNLAFIAHVVQAKVLNLQSRRRAAANAEYHYNLGNDFYRAMLDPYMQYTCAYFKDTDDLNEAQVRKLDLICRKLHLKPGERVLELGCGWGGFARFAAERYGCHVTAVNVSSEQVAFAREFCRGLPVEILHCDYREATGTYDKVASIGMTEHVGERNYRMLMDIVHRCLRDGGLFLLHTIGSLTTKSHGDPWLTKYIFPGSQLPSAAQLTAAFERVFTLEDWHNFGADYARTLDGWFRNFVQHWGAFAGLYGERFFRMWKYYLLSCEALFRARYTQLWQIVLSKNGVLGGYQPVR